MNRPHAGCAAGRPRSAASFSLVEVAIALGVIAFCVLPIVGAMAIAHQSSRAARENMERVFVIQSMETRLQAMPFDQAKAALSPAANYYFALGGQFLGTGAPATGAFYRCSLTPNAAPSSTNRFGATLVVEFPAPNFPESERYNLTFFRYGSQF